MFKSACVWETPFYASFSVKKKSQQAAGHTAPSAGSRVVALWPSSGPVLEATLLVYARDKIQMVPERWELSSQNYKMNSGILFDTLGDKVYDSLRLQASPGWGVKPSKTGHL